MSITITVHGLNEVVGAIKTGMEAGIQQGSLDTAKLLQKDLNKAPGPVARPIQWKSQRQRRFYFAMRAALVGGEQRRVSAVRGARNKGWQFARSRRGYDFAYTRRRDAMSQDLTHSWKYGPSGRLGATLGTSVGYGPFVQGDWRQPFHRNTGWYTAESVARTAAYSGQIGNIYLRALKTSWRALR